MQHLDCVVFDASVWPKSMKNILCSLSFAEKTEAEVMPWKKFGLKAVFNSALRLVSSLPQLPRGFRSLQPFWKCLKSLFQIITELSFEMNANVFFCMSFCFVYSFTFPSKSIFSPSCFSLDCFGMDCVKIIIVTFCQGVRWPLMFTAPCNKFEYIIVVSIHKSACQTPSPLSCRLIMEWHHVLCQGVW